MGLFFRKSVSVGPLRFNFSKSGIGLSAGVRGLRFGISPRGNYVHMGRGGIYYRALLGGAKKRKSGPSPTKTPRAHAAPAPLPDNDVVNMREIESEDTLLLVDESSQGLIDEIRAKQKTMAFWPWVLALGIGIALWRTQSGHPSITGVIAVIVLVAAIPVYLRDKLRKTTIIAYDFDNDMQQHVEALYESIGQLAKCARLWHIESEGRLKDRKRNAGADTAVKRTPTSIGNNVLPHIKTNIDIPMLGVGRQMLCFFPDRILIIENKNVGALAYESVGISIEKTRFVEEESVPRDAQIVDRTWKYVNKKGGPDKRFKDNKQFPVALYETIDFTSPQGLRERIMLSSTGMADNFRTGIHQFIAGQALPAPQPPTAASISAAPPTPPTPSPAPENALGT